MSLTRTTIGELSAAPEVIQALVAHLPFDPDDLQPGDAVLYAVGSVTLDELVMEENSGVLVTGDLVVTGLLDDRPLSADPDDMRYFVIGGDLRAGTLLLRSETYVGGSVVLDKVLIAESDGHFGMRVGGDMTGPRLIALGHHIRVAGKTSNDFAIGYLGLPCDIPKTQMGASFHPDVVNEYGGIDIEAVATRALGGKPYLAIDQG